LDQSQTLKNRIVKIYKLAIPVIFGQLGMVLLLLIDSYMIGKVGAAPLAAVGLGSTLFLSFSLFGAGCFLTLEAVSAWSKDNKLESDRWFMSGAALVLILSVLMTFGQELLSRYITSLPGDRELLLLTEDYLSMVKWCLFPYFCFFSLRQFLAGREVVKISTLIIFAACLVNIFLNWVFIYGNLGFDREEVIGAARATILTRYFMFLTILVVIVKNHIAIIPSGLNFCFENFKKLLIFALPSGSQIVLRSIVFSIAGLWMAQFGVNATAAHSISINIASFLYMVPIGLSTAFAILQAKQKDSLKTQKNELIKAGVVSSVPFMAIIGLLTYFSSAFIIQGFTSSAESSNTELYELGSKIFLLFPLFQIFDCFQGIISGSLRGVGDTSSALFWHLIAYWAIGLPLSYYLAFQTDFAALGIWLGLGIGLVLASLGIGASWRRYLREIPA
jgi:MATE family multidrug resistance protein